jgi:hypothetical protein
LTVPRIPYINAANEKKGYVSAMVKNVNDNKRIALSVCVLEKNK